jgi:hypothetical protein
MPLTRRTALLACLALAACGDNPKPVFAPLDFDYLTKIKLDVGSVDIDDSWAPRGQARHVEFLAPTRPSKAMRLMAEQRLVPGGTTGRALFTIDDASIILNHGSFEGSFAVHLDIFDIDDNKRGTASAAVHLPWRATDEEDEDATRTDLDALTRKMMADLNVEFEFQVRQAFKQSLQTTSPSAPAPAAVDSQDLPTQPPQP